VIFVEDTPTYERYALGYMQDKTSIRILNAQDLERHLIYYPFTYPCLVGFYTTINREGRMISHVKIGRTKSNMKFRIKVSPSMGKDTSPLGSIENRLIRIPLKLREEFGLEPGLFLCLNGKDEEQIALQVSTAYAIDALKDGESVCVNKDTHALLDLNPVSSIRPADDILIGCDPEFFIVNKTTGFNVSASHFFPSYGEVGSDCGLAEIRPRPSLKEKGVSDELYKLMAQAHKHISDRVLFRKYDLRMVAASHCNNASAGYHIHFGLPQFMLQNTHALLGNIVSILDYYVGIPAVLPEGNEDFYRRSRRFSHYGKPGDFRHNMMTLEYRVPGGHLLRHPILSSGILSIGIVVMKDILSRLNAHSDRFRKKIWFRDYKDLRQLYPNLPDRNIVYDSVVSETMNKAMSHIDAVLNDLSMMIGFKDNQEQIINYFDYILNYAHKKARFNENIELNWRLPSNEEQQREMAVLQSSI